MTAVKMVYSSGPQPFLFRGPVGLFFLAPVGRQAGEQGVPVSACVCVRECVCAPHPPPAVSITTRKKPGQDGEHWVGKAWHRVGQCSASGCIGARLSKTAGSAAQYLLAHAPVLVRGPVVGDPWSAAYLKPILIAWCLGKKWLIYEKRVSFWDFLLLCVTF